MTHFRYLVVDDGCLSSFCFSFTFGLTQK